MPRKLKELLDYLPGVLLLIVLVIFYIYAPQYMVP